MLKNESISIQELIEIINQEYLIDVEEIEKNKESTVGNVYIIYGKDIKFVAKIYDDLNHTKSMVNLHSNLSDKFYIPKIIQSKNNNMYIETSNAKYIVLYSFLDGIQVGKMFNKLTEEVIKEIALELRRLHDLTSNSNKYNLKEVPFTNDYNITRSSLLHFDLTKHNIFYNDNKIGFIDFDDAKYGISVCDVAILIALLFFSKQRGVDLGGLNLFIDTYYGKDLDLKSQETKYIKEIAINWIDYVLDGNEFDTSTKESFDIKKKLIEENLFSYKRLIPFKECINKDLYEMYQDIPFEEIGSINKLNGVSYEEFLDISKKYIEEEININKDIDTTTLRYILYIDNTPVGEVGIRTTINDYWKNRGSQIYYKIRKSQRGKGYGNMILNLALKEALELGFKKIRINCDNKNIVSKKVILKNGGKKDIVNYKTRDGYSTSYLITIKEKEI